MTGDRWPEGIWSGWDALNLEQRILHKIRTNNAETSPAARALLVVCARHTVLMVGPDEARVAVCLSCTDGYDEHDAYPCAEVRAIAEALGVPRTT